MNFSFNDELILENERVKLLPLSLLHFDVLLPLALAHPDLLKFSPNLINSEEKLRKFIETALENRKNKIRYAWAIFDKKIQSFAGSTSFGAISNENERLEIGWTWLGKAFQGTGINKRMKFLLLEFAFETLKVNRVEFKTDSRNAQSRAALSSIGAVFEGELRQHVLMSDGFRRNSVYYSILKDEWAKLKHDSRFKITL